jgi:hypothetical protein
MQLTEIDGFSVALAAALVDLFFLSLWEVFFLLEVEQMGQLFVLLHAETV